MNNKILYTPREAYEKLTSGTAVLVDVRDAETFAQGHIPGAVNIPEMFTTLSMTTPEGLQEMQDIFVPLFRKAGIRHDQVVIVFLILVMVDHAEGIFSFVCLAIRTLVFLMEVCLNG